VGLATLPLAHFELFRTTEPSVARARVERILSPHRLEIRGEPREVDVRYHYLPLAQTALIYARYGAPVRIDPGVLEDYYLVGVQVSGEARLRWDGGETRANARYASVQSCTRPLVSEWYRGCGKVTAKIERRALESRLAELLDRPLRRPVEFEPTLDLESRPGAGWRRMLGFLLEELTPGSPYLATGASRRAVDEMLILTLLHAQRHNYSDTLAAEARPSSPAYVGRAADLLAGDPARPWSMRELAALSGTSLRSLQSGFLRYRGMTPGQFVRARRLEQARAILRSPRQTERVTDVAFRVGYGHLGRFARDYRARYGESPSRTLARARAH